MPYCAKQKPFIMKLFSKILLGAALLTSGSVMAQGKSGMHGNNGNHKTETVKTHSTNRVINANEHANENGQMHASDRSILNRRSTTTVRVKHNNGNHYGKMKHSHRVYTRKHYVKKDN